MKLNQHQPISLSDSARVRVLTATRSNFFPHHAWLISLKITLILVITILIGWGLRQALVKTVATQQQRHLQPIVSKSHYQATETIEFRLDISTSNLERVLNQLRPPQAKAAEPTTSVEKTFQSGDTVINAYLTNPSGDPVNTPVQITPLSPTTYQLKVSADSKFQPGSKTLIAEVIREGETTTYKQDFTWGVLALNTNKANYQPGETAKISLAVLNRTGHMVCDAQLDLSITNPDGSTQQLSTQDHSIQLNQQECQTYAVTDRPDYESTYTVNQIGNYQLHLTATTNEGQFELSEQITVAAQTDFVIERLGATRIYPYATQYTNLILITPTQDFSGTITETLPASFKVVDRSSPEISQEYSAGHERQLSWQVDWRAGETHALQYTYSAPGVSPMFYLLGPVVIQADNANIPAFIDGRTWQIASDATVVYDSFTESTNTVLTSHTPDTGTSWTKVWDSYTTSETYVLASSNVVKAPASVTGVGQAFTAQPAASGTDQDVSFKINNKPTTTGTRPAGVFGRYTDNNNFYHVQILQNESPTDSVRLIKFVSGSATVLDSSDETLQIGDVVKLEIRDATKKVYINDTEILSSTDNSITSGTGWGLYFGNFNGAGGGTYHMRAEWEFDDFLAEEPGATNSAPTAPTNLYTEGATNPTRVTDTTPEFSAIYNDPNASDTAEYYEIEVNTASDFTGTVMWDTGKTAMTSLNQGSRSTDVSYAGTSLVAGATYYWRIKFWDAADAEGAWSSAGSFSLNAAPTSPTFLLTEGEANPLDITDTTPEFSAIYNDPNSSDTAHYYEIEVNTECNFTGTMMWDSGKTAMSSLAQGSRSTDISYAGSALSLDTYYCWHIKFWDAADTEGDFSASGIFMIVEGNSAPTAPTDLYTEGATNPTSVADTTPEFSAIYNDPNSADTAHYYEIEVNTASNFSGTSMWDTGKTSMASINQGSRSGDISYAGTSLVADTTYYWRIRFWDSDDAEGAWSSVANFTMAAASQTTNMYLEGINAEGIKVD